MQDLTIVAPGARPENRRSDEIGLGQWVMATEEMPSDRAASPGQHSLQQSGEVGDHHLLQVRQQDEAETQKGNGQQQQYRGQ